MRPNSAPLASRPRAVAHQRQPPRPLFACSWPRFLSGRVQRFGSGKPNGIITQTLCRLDHDSFGFVAISGVTSNGSIGPRYAIVWTAPRLQGNTGYLTDIRVAPASGLLLKTFLWSLAQMFSTIPHPS